MGWLRLVVWGALAARLAAVKVKVVNVSEQDESRADEDEWGAAGVAGGAGGAKAAGGAGRTLLPFLRTTRPPDDADKPRQLHPNEMIFPLIYRQSHINSMFKFGENWYTWSTEKRTDGSKAINYYICYDEPKRCDDVGWERTDSLPKCAFQIDSLMPEDRACINPFGVEPHNSGACDGAEQMKVADMVRACGPRIRSLWRFLRVARRPAAAAKPADVNSLICEDEEECYISIEYRIHHDRITFSLHEPTRGQTFKSALKREPAAEEEGHEGHEGREGHDGREGREGRAGSTRPPRAQHRGEGRAPKFHVRARKPADGKGVQKERNDSGYARRAPTNKIKVREDISDDFSE